MSVSAAGGSWLRASRCERINNLEKFLRIFFGCWGANVFDFWAGRYLGILICAGEHIVQAAISIVKSNQLQIFDKHW